jgi:hypothetical protein
MAARIVHFAFDTLPRLVTGPAGVTRDLMVPFRIETDDPDVRVVAWHLDVDVDGRSWSTRSRTRRLRHGFADGLREQMKRQGRFHFEQLPYYVGLDERGDDRRAHYLEGRVPRLRDGAQVTYSLEVTLRRGQDAPTVLQSPTYSTYAVHPSFDRDDITRIFIREPGAALDAWVLYHRRDGGFDHVRIDVVDLEPDGHPVSERADLVVEIGDRLFDLRDPGLTVLPLVDIAADSVTMSVPSDGDAVPRITVAYRGADPVEVDPGAPAAVGKARVMFVNFAIQGLNDFFATADDDYSPPRTYTQVTMRDEAASFSSRPGSRENTTGDGYAFTLEAHRRYRIPQMWAMNGGLLDLLAHDCPDDLAQMRQDVQNGLLVPVVAGFGAHRLPYYTEATNIDAIEFGVSAMREILGTHRPVYYPDSRITTDRDNVTGALQATGMEYLVVDGGRHEDAANENGTIVRKAEPPMGQLTDGRWVNWQYLWRDRSSGTKVLFIDREMKDGLLGADQHDADRGKVSFNLRRKFIELAAQPELRRDNLLVYSDDADKASGNGWFDGVYDGNAVQYNQRYQAALSWIAAHPWVQVVTTDDLGDADCVGELDLVRATDPYIEEQWRLPVPVIPTQDFGLAFDTWYAAWSGVRAAWLGETLGEISDRAERAIARWRARDGADQNEMVALARMYFTMCLHESQWSKRARINTTDPEDFVIAESLQLRNAHVYLNAGFWAEWAASTPTPQAHRDSGPVVDLVAEFEQSVDQDAGDPPAWRRPGFAGLQWDHDPLPNIVLYNEQALVVIDRNGGRITHLFSMVDGRPCSVSGTLKAYQFLDLDWSSDSGTECDGIVLQNTVWTPNHAYVACDVEASRGTVGASPSGDAVFDWYYPDNFNAYDADPPGGGGDGPSVTLEYGDGAPIEEAPDSVRDLNDRLDQDRVEKLAGNRGVVLHDVDAFGHFRKTISLDGKTVYVTYRDTRPGHLVANEFCVDLLAAAMRGQGQTYTVSAEQRSATLANQAGLAVQVELGQGCAFTEPVPAPPDRPTVDTLRLHRVMTDDVEIVAPDGGDFDYRIVLP